MGQKIRLLYCNYLGFFEFSSVSVKAKFALHFVKGRFHDRQNSDGKPFPMGLKILKKGRFL